MLDLSRYQSLGDALRDATEKWADETCLIEADRERENCRLTYRDFNAASVSLASYLQDREFQADDRAAIVMTNQSQWLISAYAIFLAGGVLVPLDYKLTASEQLSLLKHCRARVLIVEYHLWRLMIQAPEFTELSASTILVTEAPPAADLRGAKRWEDARSDKACGIVARQRSDWACIVYSSGTGGRPKGCVLTHDNYLEQCRSLTSLFPFWPGVRYLSVLPTNHAIDFMVGFIGPFVCGATVVHLRTLRPEYVREAFTRYKITYMALVPTVLKNLEKGLRARFDDLAPGKRFVFDRLLSINRALTRRRPKPGLSRRLLPQVHNAFGGELRALFVGGAFTDPATVQFFYDLGIPIGNGYGLTEAGTAVTLNDFNPFRADTVGKPLPGVKIEVRNPDREGVGQVAVKSRTVMSHYLDDPELSGETIVDGWLMTGDLGRVDVSGHLQLLGRVKNMIVTEEGKNVYPEDIETVFEGLPAKEFCVFAANYIWPERSMLGERLVLVVRPEEGETVSDELRREIHERNRRLLNFKRVSGYVCWPDEFPRTASQKIKRYVLAEEIRQRFDRQSAIQDL
jgi:long-chain acyl-CoA synthetase